MLPRLEGILADAIAAGQVVLDVPIPEARDLIIAVAHGLTAQHMANDPGEPAGSGRFGGRLPAAVGLFRAAWDPQWSRPVSRGLGDLETDTQP
jgi:hypothetical protein